MKFTIECSSGYAQINIPRTALLVLVFLLISLPALAQTPRLINYQARLTVNDTVPVDGVVTNVRFSIYDDPDAGNQLWTELYGSVVVDNGMLSVILGSIEPLHDSVFNDSSRYIGVQIDTDPEMRPRSRLMSVPYAFRISTIDGADGGTVRGGIDIASLSDTSSLTLLGPAGQVLTEIQGAGQSALSMSDSSGTVRYTCTVAATGAEMRWIDPLDEKRLAAFPSRSPMATGTTLQIGSGGLAGFGASPADTLWSVRPDGSITGRGRLVMGDSSVGAANWSTVLGYNNRVFGDSGTIGGGWANIITAESDFGGTISGGGHNKIRGNYGTIGGGFMNYCDTAAGVTIGGGFTDSAQGSGATIAGGKDNVVDAVAGTIGGGAGNRVTGAGATIPGGTNNMALGSSSVAMGSKAHANHSGSFVFAANASPGQSDSVASGGPDQIVMRADGGMYITNLSEVAPYDSTRLINTSSGAYLTSTGTWTNSSDRNLKENFEPVSSDDILDRLEKLPITRWNYKNDDNSTVHIGPMAQDLYQLFGVGTDSLSISTIDPSGIALAAIKGLIEKTKEIDQLKGELAELKREIERLREDEN